MQVGGWVDRCRQVGRTGRSEGGGRQLDEWMAGGRWVDKWG